MSPNEILVPKNYSLSYAIPRPNLPGISSAMIDDEVLVADTRSRISPAQAVDSKLLRTAHRTEEYNRGTHFIRNVGRASKD